MKLKNKRVLVTGAGGFIGSHLCEALLHEGANVRALLRYTSRADYGNLEWLGPDLRKGIEAVRGDVRDENSVRRAMKGREIVFHLAAIISVPYSFVSPTECAATNVLGTANMLAAARDEGVSAFVHTSTSEVFGTGQYVPMDEEHPLQAQSPYAASKIGADKLAESYHRTYGLPVAILRPFNTFGPRQSLRAIIPTLISQALVGNQLSVGALDPKRDFTFVKDTVRAFLLAAQTPRAQGEFINVGTNTMWSVRKVITLIEKLLGKHLKIHSTSERLRPNTSEVFQLLCNPKKAKRLLGWSATTSFEDGLSQTIQWWRAHNDSLRPSEYHL